MNSTQLRASYTGTDAAERVVGATALCFSSDGTLLHCGAPRGIRTFAVARPGRVCTPLRGTTALAGRVSALAACAHDPRLLAAGTTARTAAVFSVSAGACVAVLPPAHCGGITHVALAPDGTLLCTGARRDDRILVWDLRHTAAPLLTLARPARTNQHIAFSLYTSRSTSEDGLCLVSGTTDGAVVAYALSTGACIAEHCAPPHVHSHDAVNGADMHPTLPFLATTTGQRPQLVPPSPCTSDSDSDSDNCTPRDGCRATTPSPALGDAYPPTLRIFRVPQAGEGVRAGFPCTQPATTAFHAN